MTFSITAVKRKVTVSGKSSRLGNVTFFYSTQQMFLNCGRLDKNTDVLSP